jgi:DNA polymerase III delta prime subunit
MEMNELDWAQKYRPATFDDLVLPPGLSTRLRKFIADKGGMSLMFTGKPGCGKSTVAKLINPDSTYFINCTTDNSIDMVRGLARTCSSVTLDGERRVVVLDEADYLSKDAQAALRGVVESMSSVNDFIMTANEPERLSDAIRSRFLPIPFDFFASEEFKQNLLNRLRRIATCEGHGDVSDVQLRAIIKQRFPDIRGMIKQMQFDLMDTVATT